jgi:glutamate-ammonia-ligase adenylyltransferase
MARRVWDQAVAGAPVPERARAALARLRPLAPDTFAAADAATARAWCALWSGSEWAAEVLARHPEWLEGMDAAALAHARRIAGLAREVEGWLASAIKARDFDGALARVRRFKHKEMIRIAMRDLARLASTQEIISELSDVADVCLDAVWRVVMARLVERFGHPFEEDEAGRWHPSRAGVIGLGKLGGRELNYSSDVDVLVVYSEEGGSFREAPRRGKAARPALGNHPFFTRVAETFVAEVGRMTEDGTLFRIDLRLRPEGSAGPLVRSLASYENYYAQWGRTWERMMLLKARGVAGDATLAGEFIEMVQPFRHPRSVNERVLDEVAEMKARIEAEVVRGGELDRNVKLGRGGIREIEFIAQTQQVLRAGRNPFLQGAETVPALRHLAQYELIAEGDAAGLIAAYDFLRDVEHRLQMEQNRQTHTLPVEAEARGRLARLMGCASAAEFERRREEHCGHVRAVYERMLKRTKDGAASALPAEFDGMETRWLELLGGHAFREPGRALQLLKEFALGPGYGHVSARTTELARQLIPRLLEFSRRPAEAGDAAGVFSDPDRVLARLDAFVSAYGARATLYEMWAGHLPLFDLLLFLFDRSEFLAEVAIRTPDMVDELMLSGHLQRGKDAARILAELRHGRADADQKVWLRRYHRSELMRLGLRDILGWADAERNVAELSALAGACLQYAVEVVMRRHRMRNAPFAVIGLGKLGGAELNYGSDLDILFVTRAPAKKLPGLQSLAVEVMDLLSGQTELGVAFQTDARLRPDGEKGLLVNTLPAFERYYRGRAALWEIQSLTRARFVAGDGKLGGEFERMAARCTDFRSSPGVAAFTPEWRRQVVAMRERIERERTPAGQDALGIKTGRGGLMDAEFLAQTLALANGWREPNTLRALERAGRERLLTGADAGMLLAGYRELRRVEAVLRRWSFAGETVLPDDPAPLYRVAVRCGWRNAEEFMAALRRHREAVRAVFDRVMQ